MLEYDFAVNVISYTLRLAINKNADLAPFFLPLVFLKLLVGFELNLEFFSILELSAKRLIIAVLLDFEGSCENHLGLERLPLRFMMLVNGHLVVRNNDGRAMMDVGGKRSIRATPLID